MNQRALRPIGRDVLLAVLLPALAAAPARAQERDEGQRVRVTVQSAAFTGVKEGVLVRGEPGRLSLMDAGTRAIAELPLDAIVKVEARREHRATKKGLLIGMGVGGVLAILGASLKDPPCERYPANSGPVAAAYNRECDRQESDTRLAIAGLLLVPTAIGAGLGSLTKSGTWSEVPIERFKISLRPERGGGRVGLSLAF